MGDSVNIRAIALEIILEVTEKGAFGNVVLRSVLEKYQYLGKQERAFLTRLVEGTIGAQIELDYIIDLYSKVKTDKMKPVIRGILRMSVYQLRYMDSVPASAACNEAVKLAAKKGFKPLTGFVNGVLRNISRNIDNIEYPNDSIRYSMPQWIIDEWNEDYGAEQTKKILEAFSHDAPLTIRTNLEKITPDELIELLQNEGVTVSRVSLDDCPKLDYAFAISGFDYLGGLKSFNEGLFYVQDISSMMVAEAAEPHEGDYCIDVCAAPGGKSIHIAEKLHGTGMVDARDISEAKTALIRDNIARSRISNISAKVSDALIYDDESRGKADILIADLPCSGLGILRKKSDIKYRMTRESQGELVSLQRKILSNVRNYVKPGGKLIYSTCTMHRAENEDNVSWFLGENPDFKLLGMKQIFPGDNMGDGFFIAKLIRQNDGGMVI